MQNLAQILRNKGVLMFKENYSIETIISAVVTLGVILICVRIYLKMVNKKSKIQKPEWMSEGDFNERFNIKKRK